jgi:enoyl-[acyl-carrier-protein] reductase (NADH)
MSGEVSGMSSILARLEGVAHVALMLADDAAAGITGQAINVCCGVMA